jgi:glycosyltransferase involved in cell wall biosynthesis
MTDQPGSNKNMGILLLGSQIATGGSQNNLLRQAAWLHERGYSVTAAFLYDKEKLLPSWSSNYPFPIHDLGFAPPTANIFMQAVLFVRGVFRLFRLIGRRGTIAIETFTHHANLIGLPAAWMAGIPNRIGSHRGKIEGFPPILERLHAMMINSPIATRLVVVAQRVREDALAEGVHTERIITIVNGVNIPKVNKADVLRVRAELGLRDDDIILLSVGRLRYQKGHDILLQALPKVLEKFPNAMLLIAGEGVLRQELETEASQLGVAKRVKLLGVREDIPMLLSAADLFLFPSRFEGMPNALMEAMGYGLAVVATAVQGVDEMIRDGENGILIPMDDPKAVSDAILRLLNDPDERKRLGRAAQATIEKEYTLDKMCAQYESLLTSGRINNS